MPESDFAIPREAELVPQPLARLMCRAEGVDDDVSLQPESHSCFLLRIGGRYSDLVGTQCLLSVQEFKVLDMSCHLN